MTLLDNLLKLYKVDSQVRGLRHRVDAATRYHQAQTAQHDEIRGHLDELKSRKRHLQAKIKNLEVQTTQHDAQLEKFRNDLHGSSTAKQYNAVLTELNTVKEARNVIEDNVLEELERVEAIEKEIEEVVAQLAERAKVCEVAAAQLAERQDEVGTRLAELEAERAIAAEAIPVAHMALFEEISHVHDGEAMAPIDEIDRRRREYACGECNMHLPFEQVSVLMGSGETIMRCPACGRILYLQDEVRGALTPK